MEIPLWLNPEELGKRTAEWWIEHPSSEDPTKSNGRVLFETVVGDIQDGRSIAQPYVKPIKDAVRRGFVKAAETKGYASLEDADVALRKIDLDSIDL